MSISNHKVLLIHPKDNVLVALQDLKAGETITFDKKDYILAEDIPAKHKFFMHDMQSGDEIIMYGVLVGKAQMPIPQGARMTVENTKHAATPFYYRKVDYHWHQPDVSKFQDRTFNGYHRNDGKVGTENFWLFIPMAFCENKNLDVIKEALHHELGYATTDKYKNYTHQLLSLYRENKGFDGDAVAIKETQIPTRIFKNVDGIKFLNCQEDDDTPQHSEMLSKLWAAYADHPNVAGITVLSLGRRHLRVQNFLNDLEKRNPKFDKPLLIFEQQENQSEEAIIEDAIKKTFLGLIEINKTERQPAPLSKLTIGVKCGGSDGFSGISANPAVGYAADLLVTLGGKILLAEFPELCGAEQNLIDRTEDKNAAEKFIRLMTTYSKQAENVGSGFYMNPSPGNIKDGLITDAIKSAGAAKKGGISPVVDVLDYTEEATKPGLSLVCTPGNDVEATTGKAASGATLILFTTGLGTPTGNPVCPVIKVASNSKLANKMSDIIDIDTGAIIRGEATIQQTGEAILEFCIKVAGGEIVPKAMQLNQDDFIPWKREINL